MHGVHVISRYGVASPVVATDGYAEDDLRGDAMPQTPHVETHFTSSERIRDIVIGMSDGLTVPFALARRPVRRRGVDRHRDHGRPGRGPRRGDRDVSRRLSGRPDGPRHLYFPCRARATG